VVLSVLVRKLKDLRTILALGPNRMQRWLVGVFLTVLFVWETVGFPHIAPSQACWTMSPMHRGAAQRGTAPFRIQAPSTYRPGQEYEVTINATGLRRFKGFMLQARKTSGHDTVGTFRATNTGTKLTCNNAALCHNSAQDKTEIKGMWRAPATAVGTIVFKATFVESFTTCWTGVTSAQVSPPSS